MTTLKIKQVRAGQLIVGNVLVIGDEANITFEKIVQIDVNSSNVIRINVDGNSYFILKQEDCWIVN